MKRLLLFSLLLMVINLTFAQESIPYSESFDSGIPSSWSTEVYSGSYNWTYVTSGSYPTCSPNSGSGMVRYQSYNANIGQGSYLVSPAIDLSSGKSVVSFYLYRYTTYMDRVDVYVSLSDTTDATSQLIGTAYLSCNEAPTTSENGWSKFSFNIPDTYSGTSNHIILKAVSDYGVNLFLDDFAIIEVPKIEPAITEIVSPDESITVGDYNLVVTLKNNGTDTLTSCDISYEIGSTTATYNWTGKLAYLESTDVKLADNFSFEGGRTKINVTLTKEGDSDLSNNTLQKSITCKPFGIPFFEDFTSEAQFNDWSTEIVAGWNNWYYATKGTYPSHGPHSSTGLALFTYQSGQTGLLISPAINMTGHHEVDLSFWVYRDAEYQSYDDFIEIFVGKDDSTTQNSILLDTIYRSISMSPVVSTKGWYQYTYTIPDSLCTDSSHVIFRATGKFGNEQSIDDILITSPSYKVTYSVGESAGAIETISENDTLVSGDYIMDGSVISFKAIPDEHYKIKEWVINDTVYQGFTGNEFIVSSLADSIDVVVNFELITFPVTYASADENGIISAANGTETIESGAILSEGSTIIFTAQPAEGYLVSSWTINDTIYNGYTDSTLTISSLTDTLNVVVAFDHITFPVTYASADENGSLYATIDNSPFESGAKIIIGSQLVFTAQPVIGYEIESWTINDTLYKGFTESTFTISSLTDTLKVEVAFNQITYVVNYSTATEDGSITATVDGETIDSGAELAVGSKIVFTALPNTDFEVSGWRINETEVLSDTLTYTIDSLSEATNIVVSFDTIPATPPTTSVMNLNFSNISVFPNPATDGFYISGLNNSCTLTVFTIKGSVLKKQTVEEGSFISTDDWTKGIYILSIDTKFIKLVVQK